MKNTPISTLVKYEFGALDLALRPRSNCIASGSSPLKTGGTSGSGTTSAKLPSETTTLDIEKNESEKNPPIPKLALRRNSLTGSTWTRATTVASAATADYAQSSQQPLSTRMVAGNAVSSMFSAIRATFKPSTDVTTLASQTDPGLVATRLVNGNMFMEEPVGSVLGKVVSAQHNRSSSASRGRGLNRAKKDL